MTDLARRALRLLDLTDLSDNCTQSAIDTLCRRAVDPRGPVAAVCLWPQFVKQAKDTLRGSSVRVATVVNFPSGAEDVERVIDATTEALADGADEIDVVLPWRALLAGDVTSPRTLLEGVRDVVDRGRVLKVILETGELKDPATIRRACGLALAAGADFLKTSTGKTPVSATPEAARVMLEEIRAAGRPVGLKPSGGIRTLADAATYLDLADEIMGPDWVTPATFRFGASGLYDALVAALDGRGDAPAREGY